MKEDGQSHQKPKSLSQKDLPTAVKGELIEYLKNIQLGGKRI